MKILISVALLAFAGLFQEADAAIAWTTPSGGTGTLTLSESQAISTTVATYAATGAGTITYSIVAGGPPFQIDSANGDLSLSAALDFETAASVSVEIQAVDTDTTPATGTATITVTVTDAYPPTFSSPPTTACILDNSAADTTLTTVLATDTETGQTVTHAIAASGNTNTDFKIDGTTGVIQVNTGKTLDKATTATYTLEIEADDGALTSTTTITVTVADTCTTDNGSAAVALSFVALFAALIASLY